jgi:glycosyltransferase involved in cell wall biosynthesis
MLDPWFKRTYPLKHLKKWAYWPWAEYRVLRDASSVIFTTEEERLLAHQSFWMYRATERVVPFGTSAPPQQAAALREQFLTAWPELRGKKIVLFLSRIHEPLQALARSHGVAERITWPGMLQHDMKWGAFYASDVFALPSHQENFGVAVAEALACGLPVLISDKVGVWREVEADRAGFVSSDTINGTQRNLEAWQALGEDAKAAMRVQARRTFDERFGIESMVDGLAALLQPHAGASSVASVASLRASSDAATQQAASLATAESAREPLVG